MVRGAGGDIRRSDGVCPSAHPLASSEVATGRGDDESDDRVSKPQTEEGTHAAAGNTC